MIEVLIVTTNLVIMLAAVASVVIAMHDDHVFLTKVLRQFAALTKRVVKLQHEERKDEKS